MSRDCERDAESSSANSVIYLQDKKVLTPMTKEEWEKKQKELRHVFDPDSGRTRLVLHNLLTKKYNGRDVCVEQYLLQACER